MSNEKDQLIELTATQQNPGAAKPTDFVIEDRDGGQRGDTERERAALLAEADCVGEPLPERNEVPPGRLYTQGNVEAQEGK